MITPVFKAKNKDGKVDVVDKVMFDRYLKTLPEDVHLVVKKVKNIRSREQNRYYHGVILYMLSEYTGYTHDEMHEICKRLFLLSEYEFDSFLYKDVIKIPRSTTSLSTTEMNQYWDSIRHWAQEDLGLYIPNPDECENEENVRWLKV